MAEGKKSFVLYSDLIHTVSKMPSDKAGDLFKHILSYVNDEEPISDDLIIQLTFEPIKQQLKRDLKKWEKQHNQRVEAGKRSAEVRKRNSTSVNERSVSSTVSVNVNVNDIQLLYDKFVEEVKSGGYDSRVEAMYMRLKLQKGSLTQLIQEFKLHLVEENRLHKNTNDLFINFKNWLNIQETKGKLKQYKL